METNIVNGPWTVRGGNAIEFPTVSGKPPWAADLNAHGRMMRRYAELVTLKKQVNERSRALDPAASIAEQADRALKSLPCEVRVRISVRLGLATLRRAKAQSQTPADLLNDEIRFLKAALASKRADIERLETRILAARPENATEAKMLLKFVSRLVAVGRKFDDRNLADFLENCALAVSTPANTTPKTTKSG